MPLNPSITLQPHQQRLRDEATQAATLGQPFSKLLVWQVGSGKGPGALAAADALGGSVGVIAPAAVRPTLQYEGQRFLGQSAPPVISYQAASKRPDFSPGTLIVDEAQRMGSPGSAQARTVLAKAQDATNVLLLSGTPVRNHPREAAPIIAALTRQPFTHEDFDRQFIGTEKVRPGGVLGWLRGAKTVEQPTLKNVDELKQMLAGKIDYYESTTPPAGAPNSVKHEDVEVELTPRQAQLHEAMMGRLPALTRWKLRWNYPLSDEELMRTRAFLTGPRQLALSDHPFHPSGDALRAFDNSGKLRTAFSRLKTKLDGDARQKAIVYSNFPEAGLVPYAAALAKAKIPHAIFHGGLTDEARRALVSDFNSGKTRVALVGPAGAEGISLKGSQTVQLLDGHWNQARLDQAQARGIRFDSHVGLPDDLRDVTVERYIAKLPLGVKDRILARFGLVDPEPRRATVDDYLRNLSDRKQRLNNQFLDVLKDVAQSNRLAKTAADKLHAGDVLKLLKLAAFIPKGGTVSYDYHCKPCDHSFDGNDGRCPLCRADRADTTTNPKLEKVAAKRFHRPENYDKLRTLADGRELWAGANDWEAGFTWAWVVSAGVAKGTPPAVYTEIDHSDCPGCKGGEDTSAEADRQCVAFGKKKVDEWTAGLGKKTAVELTSYVPTAALPEVRRHGLYSGSALLRNPRLLALAAAGRGQTPEQFAGSIRGVLAGWKPDSAKGVNAVFAPPPETTALEDNHPLRRWDLTPVRILLDHLRADQPKTRVHGQELIPYAEYQTKWTPEQLATDQDDPTLRHRDLTDAELAALSTTTPVDLWKHYADPDRRGMYAPDVPHAAVITPSGRILPKYLKFPSFEKIASNLQELPLQDRLRLAKVYSDLGTPEGYAAKAELIRGAMKTAPHEWWVDSDTGHTLGVRHISGWRYHLPTRVISDIAPFLTRKIPNTPTAVTNA